MEEIVGLHAAAEPSWPLVLAWVAAGVLSGLELRSLWRRATRRRRALIALFAARGLALLLVLAAIFELSLRMADPSAQPRRIAVLFDASASMSVRGTRELPTRLELESRTWAASDAARSDWASRGLRPEPLSFGRELRPLPAAPGATSFDGLEASAERSDLFGALSSMRDDAEARSSPLAGALVFSDGRVAFDAATRAQLLELAEASPIPIHTVFTASPELIDAAVGPISAGEFAFVENVSSFEAELYTHGLEGQTLEVQLLRDGEPVASERVPVGAKTRQRVRFEVAPEQTGQFVYEVAITPVEAETQLENNRRAFVLKVLRDKIRVLHVAGRPDWDVRALRTLLRRDPNVELLSYYILRDEEDSLRSDDSAPMSLIAFPTQELFHEQLGSFDLIVLHNFDAMTHGDYLGNLARYVEQGGSLVVIGGDMGLAGGDFARSPLEPLLPLDLRRPLSLERDPFVPKLTDRGRRHPITGWLAEGERSAWAALPALDSFNRGELHPNASAIDAIPLLEGPGGAPLLSVAEPGRGRTLVLATGATWRLGFAPDLPLIDGARPYDLLWLGIVRWVLRDAAAERLRVDTDDDHYAPGQAVTGRARTLSPSYQPEAEVELSWELRPLPDPENDAIASGTWTTGPLGRVSHTFEALPVGAYELLVWRARDDEAPRARRVFVVGSRTQELADLDPAPGRALLTAIAAASGGRFVDASSGDAALPTGLEVAEGRRSAVLRARDLPVWNGWLVLVLLVGVLPIEWLARRRLGFA